MYKKIKALLQSANLTSLNLDGCDEPIYSPWYDNKGNIHEGEVFQVEVDFDNELSIIINDKEHGEITVYESENTIPKERLENIYDKLSEVVKNQIAKRKTIVELITKTLEEKDILAGTFYLIAIQSLHNYVSKATDEELKKMFGPSWDIDLVREMADYLYNTLSKIGDKEYE